MESAIFHSIKLPFDAEVAEKFSNGIYSVCVSKINVTRGDIWDTKRDILDAVVLS